MYWQQQNDDCDDDIRSLKSAAFACNQLCANELNHEECHKVDLAKHLCTLLNNKNKDIYNQALIAIRKLVASLDCCQQVINHKGNIYFLLYIIQYIKYIHIKNF